MGIGDTLGKAWNSATGAAKSTATGLANGARYVGGKVVDGAQYAGGKIVEGAQWTGAKVQQGAQYTGQKLQQGAQYTGQKLQQGAQWAGQTAKEGVRRGERAVADAVYTKLGEKSAQIDGAARNARGAYDKAKQWFTGKPPQQPCIACSNKDVDYDGVLVGYKDGKCVPLTNKGQKLTSADVQRAKASGYSPGKNPAIDPEQVKAGKDANTPHHTGKSVRQCCQGCLKGKPPKTIFYVNGINTTHQTHCDTLKQIGDMTCANVVGVYNATEDPKLGSFSIADANQTAQDRYLIKQAERGKPFRTHDGRNPAVDTLSDLIVQETREGRPPEIMAHSQGGAVTSLALYDANNTLRAGPPNRPHSLEGVKVSSFGAAAPSWVKGPNYTHYINVNDVTPMAFGLGDRPTPQKAGNGRVVTFSGEPGGPFETKNPDKKILKDATKYHGIDDQMYLKMYNQDHKALKDGQTCSCGNK